MHPAFALTRTRLTETRLALFEGRIIEFIEGSENKPKDDDEPTRRPTM